MVQILMYNDGMDDVTSDQPRDSVTTAPSCTRRKMSGNTGIPGRPHEAPWGSSRGGLGRRQA